MMDEKQFELMSFGDVMRQTGRVWSETLAEQGAVWAVYGVLCVLAVGGLLMTKTIWFFGLIAVPAMLLLIVMLPGASHAMGGMMAPAAVRILCDGEPSYGVAWHRLMPVLWASTLFGWLFVLFSNLMILPAYVVLLALWPWTMVAACEPEVKAFKRAQEVSSGVFGRVLVWYMGLWLMLSVPAILGTVLFVIAYSSASGSPAAGALIWLYIILFGVGAMAVMGLQGAFWATLYALRIRDERAAQGRELLHVFD